MKCVLRRYLRTECGDEKAYLQGNTEVPGPTDEKVASRRNLTATTIRIEKCSPLLSKDIPEITQRLTAHPRGDCSLGEVVS